MEKFLAKKSLGQNFLVDNNVIKKIVNLKSLKNRNIIEIGPGRGALTDEILKKNPKSLFLIEKDFYLFKELKYKYRFNKKVKIFNRDILNFDIEKILLQNSIIFGNLPYNISSQILVKILRFKIWPCKFSDLIFMFQKELGEKITAQFNTPNYGRLSILRNYRLRVKEDFLVSKNCFQPKPKVTSKVIHFVPKLNKSCKIKNLYTLEYVTRIIFSNKRKMINKNVKKILTNKQIKNLSFLNLSSRPTEISPDKYYKIAEIIEKK